MAIYKDDVADFIWRNGEIIPWKDALIHVNSVGHASVAGIFEGIKAYWSETDKELYIFRLRDHMKRFINSIKMVRYGFDYDLPALEKAVIDLMKANNFRENIYIRPYVFQKGMVRELLQPQPGKPTELVIDSWPFESYRSMDKALDVGVSSWVRISDHIMPPRLKCFSNYHNGRLAAMESTVNGYDWPILLDDAGKVTEGPGACLLLVRNNTVIAPPVTAGILESITRDTVARIFKDMLKLDFVERVVDRTELYAADEVFYVGTGWEIMPVASVDRIAVGDGKIGPVTRASADAYREIVLGKVKEYRDWLTPVWK